MPRIFILGDIHGMKDWRQDLRGRQPEDHAVFIGDYMDSYEVELTREECLENFLEIAAYARKWPHTTLLIGNHDFHYMPGCVNYGSRRAGEKWAKEYARVFAENRDLMRVAVGARVDGRPALLTHAGVTSTWLIMTGIAGKREMLERDYEGDIFDCVRSRFGADMTALATSLDELFSREPQDFSFIYTPGADPYGDDFFQGPLWVRPNSLLEDAPRGFDQYVGHTRFPEVCSFPVKAGDGEVTFLDLDTRVGCVSRCLGGCRREED